MLTIVSVPEAVAATYTSDWALTGNMPKPAKPTFVSDWAPTGNLSKPATPVQAPQPNFVSDWAVGNAPKARVETVSADGHFFG